MFCMRSHAIVILLLACLASGVAEAATTLAGPYRAQVLEVHDGDTFRAEIPVWLGLSQITWVRVSGIDTPELGARAECESERAAAEQARTLVAGLLEQAATVQLVDVQPDKYGGRVVARVLIDGEDLATHLIASGLAHSYDGGTKTGWCTGTAQAEMKSP